MENLINDLKYDYNYNFFLARALLPNLENTGESTTNGTEPPIITLKDPRLYLGEICRQGERYRVYQFCGGKISHTLTRHSHHKTLIRDKALVARWLQKFERCGASVDEMRVRNDFLYHLLLNVQAGQLLQPFQTRPPTGSILTFAHLMPRGGADPSGAGAEGERPLLYARSPDGGAFLAAQPVPRAGAFAYLAVLCRPTQPARAPPTTLPAAAAPRGAAAT